MHVHDHIISTYIILVILFYFLKLCLVTQSQILELKFKGHSPNFHGEGATDLAAALNPHETVKTDPHIVVLPLAPVKHFS